MDAVKWIRMHVFLQTSYYSPGHVTGGLTQIISLLSVVCVFSFPSLPDW